VEPPDWTLKAGSIKKWKLVYAVMREGVYIYVGCTESPLTRLGGHHIFGNGRKDQLRDTDEVHIWFFESGIDMRNFEFEMIQAHKPELNIVNNPKFKEYVQ